MYQSNWVVTFSRGLSYWDWPVQLAYYIKVRACLSSDTVFFCTLQVCCTCVDYSNATLDFITHIISIVCLRYLSICSEQLTACIWWCNFICWIFLTDISIAIIDLLQEMTDVDTLNESEEGATALIDALVSFFLYLIQENGGVTLGNFMVDWSIQLFDP